MTGSEAKGLESFIFDKSLASRKSREGVQLDFAGLHGAEGSSLLPAHFPSPGTYVLGNSRSILAVTYLRETAPCGRQNSRVYKPDKCSVLGECVCGLWAGKKLEPILIFPLLASEEAPGSDGLSGKE